MLGFRRAIRRLVGNLTGKRKAVFFIILILICGLAILVGIYAKFYYRYSDTDPLMIGINIGNEKTAEEIQELEANFNNLFSNSLKVNSKGDRIIDKLESAKDLVFTVYNLENQDENYYNVNVKIPKININSEKASEINSYIKTEFYDKANTIMRQKEKYTIYNVSYVAFINEDVLSIVVKAVLKEGENAEKVSIKTYNYNIPGKNIMKLTDLIELKETTVEAVQAKINDDIKTAYTNAKMIGAQYGNIYERDLKSDIYKVQNATTFFLTSDGYVYIIYAYGNNDYTNEMDIVIF